MEDKTTNAPAVSEARPLTPVERFTGKVLNIFAANAGEGLEITDFQRKLIQNYFIGIDQTLKDAEAKDASKEEKWRSDVPFEWKNVNLDQLAVDVMTVAAVGLDPLQPNHLSFIPYLNKKTKKFDIDFRPGYRGLELVAKRYGLDVPDDVVVEVVFSSDKFKVLKRDIHNEVEGYEFEVVNPFNRGEIVGGFYYHNFFAQPKKNKVVAFDMKDIEKRKPKNASVEFWGGEKTIWKDRKPTGTEYVEGWLEEMVYKTIFRAAYSDLTIDSSKIDAHYRSMQTLERTATERRVQSEIADNANTELLEIAPTEEVETSVTVQLPKMEPVKVGDIGKTNSQASLGPDFE